MTLEECVSQLKDLRGFIEAMEDNNEFTKDTEAIDTALEIIERYKSAKVLIKTAAEALEMKL